MPQYRYTQKGWVFTCGGKDYLVPIRTADRRRQVKIAFGEVPHRSEELCPFQMSLSTLLEVCHCFTHHRSSTHSSLRRLLPVILWFCYENRLNFNVRHHPDCGAYVQLIDE